jgi:hypothetical protein
MPCHIVVEGELANLRVTLVDTWGQRGRARDARLGGGFSELFEPDEDARDPGELRADLESELTDEAQRLLDSDDVTVTVTWQPGSLEVAALIACGKIVADIGAFLSGVREIRQLFPQRIRDRVSLWLGRDVAMPQVRLEARTGFLHGKSEEPTEAAPASTPFSLKELAAYAGLSLLVLVLITVLVLAGAAYLT